MTNVGILLDDLKANFRSWEQDCDNKRDTDSLINALLVRHSNVPYKTIAEWAHEWTGYEPDQED